MNERLKLEKLTKKRQAALDAIEKVKAKAQRLAAHQNELVQELRRIDEAIGALTAKKE